MSLVPSFCEVRSIESRESARETVLTRLLANTWFHEPTACWDRLLKFTPTRAGSPSWKSCRCSGRIHVHRRPSSEQGGCRRSRNYGPPETFPGPENEFRCGHQGNCWNPPLPPSSSYSVGVHIGEKTSPKEG